MPLTDEFISAFEFGNEFIGDINIYQCEACGLVQNPIDFDHERYYEQYEYSSSHSDFTQVFMRAFAQSVCDAFKKVNGRAVRSVLEIGSGDGEQLRAFRELGVPVVFGVEPSEALARKAKSIGIPTHKGLFAPSMTDQLPASSFDICVSSYTLDHVSDPASFLQTAHALLGPKGVLAFEVHDLSKIAQRGEWCLFEHEHTIYIDADMAKAVLNNNGFKVYSINPLPESVVRANSLIVLSHKTADYLRKKIAPRRVDYSGLQLRVDEVVQRIEAWVNSLPKEDRLVGFGAGGRGVMTLAALSNASRFQTIFDSNHVCGKYSTPKTHVIISSPQSCFKYNDAWCLIFSFGFTSEILSVLQAHGFHRERIISLKDFLYA